MINVAIRVDASVSIGIGHLMRCLTLAGMLKQQLMTDIVFICRASLPLNLQDQIIQTGYQLELIDEYGDLNATADAEATIHILKRYTVQLLIVDHYHIDQVWEQLIKAVVPNIMVIDDLANRNHCCDILLDQNLQSNFMTRYDGIVNPDCKLFLGPSFLLLRQEFYDAYLNRRRISYLKHILINFGGSDPTGETEKVLRWCSNITDKLQQVHFHVVAGPANPRTEQIKSLCDRMPNTNFYEQANMASLLCDMDMAIGAGGITMWERCFLGVPAAVVVVADNQYDSVQEAEKLGLIWNMGRSEEIEAESLKNLLLSLLDHPQRLRQQSEQCKAFMEQHVYNGSHPVVEYIKGRL